jgi:alcohol dehydrogenase
MIRARLLPLDLFEVTTFELDQVNEAVAHAAANGGPFKMTVLQPA